MFRSIRWRLVLSFVLLTLLTVSLVGVLALSLVQRSIGRQEVEHLRANAESVAREALPLLWPLVQQRELQDLAYTASFLGDARVRILDAQGQVLADSGLPARGEEMVWLLPGLAWPRLDGVEVLPAAVVIAMPFDGRAPAFVPSLPYAYWDEVSYHQPLSGTLLTVVRVWEGRWGSRFAFETLRSTDRIQRPAVDLPESPRSGRVVSVPLGETGSPLGYVELSAGPDMASESLATTRQAFLFAAGGATLLAAAVGLLVSRGLAAPVRELTQAADRMSAGDLSIRAAVRGRDEIGQLADRFNQMARRLEASFSELATERDALRRFIADASHELRTPITALKSFNQLLQGAATDDPAARAEFLSESQVQIQRLEWVTHNLLDLSRLDAGLVELDLEAHNLAELVEAVVAPFRPLAGEKGIVLAIEPVDPALELHCDRARMESALSNLLDNALKFTASGGRVEVGAGQEGDSIRLWVRDSGPGIGPEEQVHVFERFYRGRHQSAGSGLGLAIVQSVVQAHGGRVLLESAPGEGSCFTLQLPFV